MRDSPIGNKLNVSREHLQAAIINLRKAFALQKQVEEMCEYQGLEISYRWSLSELEQEMVKGKSLKEISSPPPKSV
jgi:hypothetical protein